MNILEGSWRDLLSSTRITTKLVDYNSDSGAKCPSFACTCVTRISRSLTVCVPVVDILEVGGILVNHLVDGHEQLVLVSSFSWLALQEDCLSITWVIHGHHTDFTSVSHEHERDIKKQMHVANCLGVLVHKMSALLSPEYVTDITAVLHEYSPDMKRKVHTANCLGVLEEGVIPSVTPFKLLPFFYATKIMSCMPS